MSVHRIAPALAAVLVLAVACGADDDPAATDPPETDQPDSPQSEDPDDPDVLVPEEDLGDLEIPEVEDGVIRAQGVVLPIPDGWVVDDMALAQGLVGASPDDAQPTQLLLAGADIETSPMFGVQGEDFEGAVETFRGLVPDGPDVDEEVALAGAERAQLLRFDELAVQEGQPPTTELVLIAEDAEGHLALFNYAAASEEFDDAIVDLLLADAGLDPDSEPTRPEEPPPPPDTGDGTDAGTDEGDAMAPVDITV